MGKDTENMTEIRKQAIERIAKSSQQSHELRFDPELWDALSKLATQRQTTVSSMVTDWIKERLAKENAI